MEPSASHLQGASVAQLFAFGLVMGALPRGAAQRTAAMPWAGSGPRANAS
jgi:hypothetical protein